MKKFMVYICVAIALLILSGCASQPVAAVAESTSDATSTANLLIFNEAEYILAVSPVFPEGSFHELTVDDVHSVFGQFMYFADLSLRARSFVRSDGYLLGLSAGDASERISIGFGSWHDLNMFADGFDEPVIVSDVHGIPVRAFVVDNGGASGIFFQATFLLDDIHYMVIHWNPNEAEGKARIAEIVSALIRHRPVLEIFSYCNALNYDRFLELLEASGFEVENWGYDEDSWLSTGVRFLGIGDEQLAIYEFNSNAEMQTASNWISPSGFSISKPDPNDEDGMIGYEISWVSRPYWFKMDYIIVRYVGENGDMIDFLKQVFGDNFAGHGASNRIVGVDNIAPLDYEAFLGLLESNGFEFESGNLYDSAVSTFRRVIFMGDERLIVYCDTIIQTQNIDRPLAPPAVQFTWSPQYMWPTKGSVTIVYTGEDERIIDFLNEIFGDNPNRYGIDE